MQKFFLLTGIFLAGLGVVLGAFGAHGLKQVVNSDSVATYQTGVQYQMYHALALIFSALFLDRMHHTLVNYAGISFIAGIVLFSGSLYLIVSLKALNKALPAGFGLITPIGGLFFIIGWILLLIAVIKKPAIL
jgi:uncharacterized membrane protein YgdD (TMEM256/DUF423 family)